MPGLAGSERGSDGDPLFNEHLARYRFAAHFADRAGASFVLDAAVTPDGRRVVSASADNTLIVWQLTSGEAERVLRGHEGYVTSAVVTPDGIRVISGSLDATIRVWDLEG